MRCRAQATASLLGVLLGAPLACGQTAGDTERSPDASVPASQHDGGSADGGDALISPAPEAGSLSRVRCEPDGGTLSPSGAPCDRSRIVLVAGRGGHYVACASQGTFCDRLFYSLGSGEQGFTTGEAPLGFACSTADLGTRSCAYEFADGGNRILDDNAIEAACRVTERYPEKSVVCLVYD